MRFSAKSVLFLLLAIPVLSGCEINVSIDDDTDEYAEEDFSYTLQVNDDAALELLGVNGAVSLVRSAAVGVVKVDGTRRVEASTVSRARAELDNLVVIVTEEDDGVVVETNQPHDTDNYEYKVTYVIQLPADMKAFVDLENGTITAQNAGRTPDVDVINGIVTLPSSYGSGSVSTTNGLITADVDLEENGELSLTTVNGNITLGLPSQTSAEFSARVTNGSISTTGLTMVVSSQSSSAVLGTLGQGQGEIDLRTVNGSINVRRTEN